MKKRAYERVPANVEISYFCGNSLYTGTITNHSENGMCISAGMCLPVDSLFEVLIPVKDKVLNIPVRVARVAKSNSIFDIMCVQFQGLCNDYSEFVKTLGWQPVNYLKTPTVEMKTFVCGVCSHITFNQAPVGCPVCGTAIENFENNPEAIKKPKDPGNPSDWEKQHIPLITVSKECSLISNGECVDVSVRVGEIQHKMEPEDRITFIDFYSNGSNNKKCLTRVALSRGKGIHPAATLHLNKMSSGIFTVISNCNSHGSWMAEANV